MYSIFTVLYCHYLSPAGGSINRFQGRCLDPDDHPEFVMACQADLESGKLRVQSLRQQREPEYFGIPKQFHGEDLYFETLVVFGEELKSFFESAGEDHVYAYMEYDDELEEFAFLDFFTTNQEFKSESRDGYSDGLMIERLNRFEDVVALAFDSTYRGRVGYDPCFKRRYNPLKGVTEAIFQGRVEGPQAELFRKIFPLPSCRQPIIDVLTNYYTLNFATMPEKFVATGLDKAWK